MCSLTQLKVLKIIKECVDYRPGQNENFFLQISKHSRNHGDSISLDFRVRTVCYTDRVRRREPPLSILYYP